MKGQFKVFDAARHVVEPADLWESRIGPAYAGAVEVRRDGGSVTVRGRPTTTPRPDVMGHPHYQDAYRDAIAADFSAESGLADMDREGIDAALLLPTFGMYAIWADHVDGDLSSAICRAYNDWLHDYCGADRERLKAVALLPQQDPEAAAVELRRAVGKGFVAGFMRPNQLVGRRPHDAAYDPLYAEAASLGVPLVLCEMGGSVLHQLGTDRFEGFFSREAVLDPYEMMLVFMSFMGHNVLERFPGLNVGYLGAGVGWLPYWLDRVDEHWGGFFGVDAPSTQAPSLMFKSQGFAAADPWERTLPEVIEECGEHTIVWGSQYPRPEIAGLFPNELDTVVNDALLTDGQKQAVLWDNAARLFKLG